MRILILAATLLVGACGQTPATPDDSIYDYAIATTGRLPGDYARDAQRQPHNVLRFLGIGPGDRVLDMYAGGGYYSEVIGRIVGPDGHVLSHANKAYLNFVGDEFNARHAGDRLSNVSVLMAENNELSLDANSLDAVLFVLAYHDVYYSAPESGWPTIDGPALLAELYKGLKPGGIVGIVDHTAVTGSPRESGGTVHRIDPAHVISDFEAAGFRLDGESDLLRNPDDDLTQNVFDEAIRGRTDRFVLRFRKPQ